MTFVEFLLKFENFSVGIRKFIIFHWKFQIRNFSTWWLKIVWKIKNFRLSNENFEFSNKKLFNIFLISNKILRISYNFFEFKSKLKEFEIKIFEFQIKFLNFNCQFSNFRWRFWISTENFRINLKMTSFENLFRKLVVNLKCIEKCYENRKLDYLLRRKYVM